MSSRRPGPCSIALAGALLLVLVQSVGCAGSGASTAQQRVLRVGISPDYPPLAYRADGELAGIELVLARKLAPELGMRAEFVELERDALIPSLESAAIDVIMSGMSISAEREQRVLFTTPYLRLGQLALIRKAELIRFGRPRAMRKPGARVGFVRGTTGQDFVSQRLASSEAYAFDSIDDGLRSLRAGRIDYFIHDAPTIWRVAGSPDEHELMGLFEPLTDEYVAWAVAAGNVALQRDLEAVLDGWRARNEIEPILNQWIPIRVRVGR